MDSTFKIPFSLEWAVPRGEEPRVTGPWWTGQFVRPPFPSRSQIHMQGAQNLGHGFDPRTQRFSSLLMHNPVHKNCTFVLERKGAQWKGSWKPQLDPNGRPSGFALLPASAFPHGPRPSPWSGQHTELPCVSAGPGPGTESRNSSLCVWARRKPAATCEPICTQIRGISSPPSGLC